MPKIGPNDVLIRIRKTAICGTDIHIYKWDEWAQKTIPVPMHVGHEFVGEIADMGRRCAAYHRRPRFGRRPHQSADSAATAAPAAAICAATPGRGRATGRAPSPSTCRSRPTTFFRSPTVSPTTRPRSSTRLATRCTRRSPSTWSARTCLSPAPVRSASWPRWSRACGRAHVVITDVNEYRMELARKLGVANVVDAARRSCTT